MAEGNARRIATVLATDSNLESRARSPSPLSGEPHKLPDTVAIEDLKRVDRQDLAVDVLEQELALGVVA